MSATLSIRSPAHHSITPFSNNVTAWRACYGAMLRREPRQSSMDSGIVTLLRRADPRGARRPKLCRELCRLPLSTLIHNRNPVPSSHSPHAPASLFAVFPNLSEPFRASKTFFSTLCHESALSGATSRVVALAKGGPGNANFLAQKEKPMRTHKNP